jgi:UDP-glucose 4-epimerase
MRVFVAGGAGYIGSIVTQRLLDAGHQVTVYDSLVKGHRQAVPLEAQFVLGDILDRPTLDAALGAEPYDAIIHFAAFIEAGLSMQQPGTFFRNNVAGSMTLIEAAAAHGVKKLVFSSSAGVYASKDTPLVEDDPIGPVSVYGHTKRMIEETLVWYHRIHGLRFAALRYFNAAGATPPVRGEAHHPETHLIPLVLQVALNQRPRVLIFGDDYPTSDGTCIRDYIHVLDLSAAHILALRALDEYPVLICNLGNGAGYSVKEVIDTARQITGHSIPAKVVDRRRGDGPVLVADASRAKALLGWVPQIPELRDIISSSWAWHQAHPKGYDSDEQGDK